MLLKTLFKKEYGKEWEQASFGEKLESVILEILLFSWLENLFTSHQ